VKGSLGHGYQPRIQQISMVSQSNAHIVVSGCTCGWVGEYNTSITNREAWREHVREQETHA
jgi:hypothetical protein